MCVCVFSGFLYTVNSVYCENRMQSPVIWKREFLLDEYIIWLDAILYLETFEIYIGM